jgi:plasmid maintenance system antidote protein VapI
MRANHISKLTGVRPNAIGNLINGKDQLTPLAALRVEKATNGIVKATTTTDEEAWERFLEAVNMYKEFYENAV